MNGFSACRRWIGEIVRAIVGVRLRAALAVLAVLAASVGLSAVPEAAASPVSPALARLKTPASAVTPGRALTAA